MTISSSEILKMSGLEIAQKIRDEEISPIETVDTFIEQIELWNPQINAVTERLFEEAKSRAEKDQKTLHSKNTDKNNLPIYFGVPCSIKEMFAIKGHLRTAGSIHYKELRPDFNATLVNRIYEAGANPLCTTNVPELGFWYETDNSVYGRTNNPYDLTRTSGGSSGGESALIAAGGSPFGLGSDVGGSIRMPAFFCGVFGHKPTWKSIPLTGHFPYGETDLQKLTGENYPPTTTGFLTKKAADLFPLMKILSGADPLDPEIKSDFKLGPEIKDFSKLKVFLLPDPQVFLCQRTDQELKDCVHQAGRLFEQFGCEIEFLDPKIFKNAVEIWGTALKRTQSLSFTDKLTNSQGLNYGKEFFNILMNKQNYTFPNMIVSLLEKIPSSPEKTEKILAELAQIDLTLKEKLGQDGILIMPPHPRVAPKHKAPYMTPFDFILTGIFNALGYPATSVPMGLNEKRLPLGVQIVAAPFQDHLNLSVANLMEATFGGWTQPDLAQNQ